MNNLRCGQKFTGLALGTFGPFAGILTLGRQNAPICGKWGLVLTLVQLASKLDLPQIGAFQSKTNVGASKLDLRGSTPAHDFCPVRTYVWIGRRPPPPPWQGGPGR
jgi:hypothetical protein